MSVRIVHTMLRTADLARALDFWCGTLALRERRRIEFRTQRYTLVFLACGEDAHAHEIELWYDWPSTSGSCAPSADSAASHAGHIGIEVDDLGRYVERLRRAGVRILREPGPTRPGGRALALIADPDGNEIELLEPRP